MSTQDDVEKEIRLLVSALNLFAPGRPLDKFIDYAYFPKYKNLVENARINFVFPFTVLVGPNGMGKSSLLQAFWGMPEGNSIGRFWYSTSIDAIEEGGEGGQHRVVYGHWLGSENRVVATRKARVTKADRGSDYWEPTKAVTSDGMEKMPEKTAGLKVNGRTNDRWNAVDREALLLNFKSELSAYDKYMYFGRDPKLPTLKSRQDVIRRDSRQLKHIIDSNSQTHSYYGRPVTAENRLLTSAELDAVSEILGRNYLEARIVRHRLFGGQEPSDGLSVIFKRPNATYSEAHAGSGEVAIVSAVVQILAANRFTLLLIDEPEVSLHPLAQRRLLAFLLNQIKIKHHQIIVSTHSAEMFRGLPKSAIKLLDTNADGKFLIRENVSPSMAFSSIGAPTPDRLTIYVEDELASIVVTRAIERLEQAERALVEISVFPNGASGICTHQIPTWMRMGNSNILVYLDGDQRPNATAAFRPSREIPASEDNRLAEIIKAVTNCSPNFPVSGAAGVANQPEKIQLQRQYIDWYVKHVRFLPLSSPEHIVLAAIQRAQNAAFDETLTSTQAKVALLAAVGRDQGNIDEAAEIQYVYKQKLFEHGQDATELNEIVSTIRPFVQLLNTN